jgi:hypothetical protein
MLKMIMFCRNAILVAFACAVLFQVETACARDYYFFNKPSVSRQDYLADRLACDQLAGGSAVRQPDMTAANTQIWQNQNLTTGQAAAASGIASLLMGFAAAKEHRLLIRQIERICLADKGYRRFEMSKKAYREIQKSKDEAERIDRWFVLASGANPEGKEMYE